MHEIRLPRPLYNQMLAHLQTHYPQEACGILAGNDNEVAALHKIDNILESPVVFKMDPRQQLRVMLDIEKHEQKMIAIFHSHPQGPERPSATDIAQAAYPDTANIIVSLQNRAAPTSRAFMIEDGRVSEIKLTIT